MSLPWDSNPQPQRSHTPQPAPQPQRYTPPPAAPPPPDPYAPLPPPPSRAQNMRPDIAPAPAPKHNDLNTMIQNAINEAIIANKDKIQANAQRALVKKVNGEKPTVIPVRKVVEGDGSIDEIEDTFEAGPATTRTFFQGMAVDVGFAVMTTLGTVVTPGFNAFDKEMWTITGVLIAKTVLTTAMSYAMKLEVR